MVLVGYNQERKMLHGDAVGISPSRMAHYVAPECSINYKGISYCMGHVMPVLQLRIDLSCPMLNLS